VWVPRRFDENAIRETAGRFLLTFRNVYNGIFAQYANFGWTPSALDPAVADRPALDRWILSRLSRVEADVDRYLTAYDATLAARRIMEFVDEDVVQVVRAALAVALLRDDGRRQPRGLRRRCTRCSRSPAVCSRRSRRS
jgi:isoleucyl-tRNA synthetase